MTAPSISQFAQLIKILVVILLRRIKDAIPECASSKDSFDVFCERPSSDNPGTVSCWTQEVEAWETGESTENPFERHVKGTFRMFVLQRISDLETVLTVTSVQLCLAKEESKKSSGTTPTSLVPSASEMIRDGLAHEMAQ